MDKESLSILLIGGDADFSERIARLLKDDRSFDHRLDRVSSLEKAAASMSRRACDVLLLDPVLPDSSILDNLLRACRMAPHVPLIVLTDPVDPQWALTALQRGAQDVLIKSELQSSSLIRAIRFAVERKWIQNESTGERYLLDALLEGIPDHIFFKDEHSRFTRINRSMARAFKLASPSQAVGRTDFDFFAKEHARRMYEEEQDIIRKGRSLVDVEMREVWPDGRVKRISSTRIPLRDSNGNVIGLFGISRDISRQKRVEEELRDAQLFLNSIVENIPLMIFVKDARDLRFVRFNRAGEELLGFTREELIGKNDYDFFPKEEADFFTSKDREVLAGGALVDIPSEPIKTRYKGDRILHTLKIPLFGDDGRPEYLLGISEDITDRVRAEEERRKEEARERAILERTDRLRTMGMLAAGVAHEVNNPLQGMLSHLGRVKRGLPADFEYGESLQMVERGIHDITILVEQLLSLGSPDRDSRERFTRCGRAFKFVFQLTETQLQKAGIEVIQEHAKPRAVLAMPEREFVQVMLNLIMNARDAMPGGGRITVRSDCLNGLAVITVSDNGKGMTEKEKNQVFAPFYTTKIGKGTGLGLSVAASLVHAGKGEIDVESVEGRGTTFTITIPLKGGGRDE